MHPLIRKRLERAARNREAEKPPRTWNPAEGIHYCSALPMTFLEPICERVSRVQGDKFDRLVASIREHGLANPLITVSELPTPNFNDWREYRFRFLYTIDAPIKVVVGHNRYAALLALGRNYVQVIHCGPIPERCQIGTWQRVAYSEVPSYFKDGKVGLGPFSLVMEQFTPPLKAMPAGYE